MGKRRNLLSEDELKIVTKTSYVESDELAFKLFFEGEVLERASSFLTLYELQYGEKVPMNVDKNSLVEISEELKVNKQELESSNIK
ncbi:hypothetical protein [Peribacillus frigoritolerans]|uniref:hypothetical protein n=1 Tax=Peribacillus frigoritolerans TaxID=450367 RepID=UPI003426068F